MHGDDGDIHIAHNAFQSALKRQDGADARDLSFGKDADRLSFLERPRRQPKATHEIPRIEPGRNRNTAPGARERTHQGIRVHLVQDQEARRPGTSPGNQSCVQKGDVIRRQQNPALTRHVLRANHIDAIQERGEQPVHPMHQPRGEWDAIQQAQQGAIYLPEPELYGILTVCGAHGVSISAGS